MMGGKRRQGTSCRLSFYRIIQEKIMRPVKRPPIHPPTIYAWKYGPGRTMETYLGYQMLASLGIIVLAEILFSLRAIGISTQAYLLAQFFILLLLCAASLAVPPLLNYLARYPFTGMNAVRDAMLAYSETEIDDEEERVAYLQEMALNGYVPPAARQQYAMAVIVCLLLCQLFVIGVWMQDGILIWRPAWVDGIIDWMRAHTGAWDKERWQMLFYIDRRDTVFAGIFPDDHAFLASPLGDSQLFFHVVLLCMHPLFIVCYYLWLSRILDYLGFVLIDPRYIDSVTAFYKSFFWFLPLLFLLTGGAMAIKSIPSLPTDNWIMGIRYWNKGAGELLVMYLLFVTLLKFLSGWCLFFARLFLPAREEDFYD